ncbi:MAG: ABC transporter permease [Hahellaceae bacterium]|nr:ABC transporter permease [Hahellaceae bacterium]MCP5169774.1 ABC transporter permease [Hahellaceae bacterium]
MLRTCLLFVVLALLCLPWADISVTTRDPWLELSRLGWGLLTPDFGRPGELILALANTLAFALQGVALGVVGGFLLALGYRFALIRRFSAFIRAIHELFWALLFIQLMGLSPLAGVLAIAIPYAGTFAKIYGELFEEVDPSAWQALPSGTGYLSGFFYTLLPQALRPMMIYTSYRLECGIRSSAVLGFIGLPTIGFFLETALKQGLYSEAAALFYALVLVIVTMRWWLQRRLVLFYLIAALVWLPPKVSLDTALVVRFFTEDIVPSPLRSIQGWSDVLPALERFWPWLNQLWQQQMWAGLTHTMILALLALVCTSVITLLWFPLISPLFGGRWRQAGGHVFLVWMRSAPEYLLAFVGLLLWGPSMLPAIVALALHNGAIIAHLVGRYSEGIRLREDAATGINRHFYEVLPRIFRPFMAFTLYRFEIIMRETAMLGILGIPTLGFYIDSAFSEFRFDRALLLLLLTAMLNMLVDGMARSLRQRLHLSSQPESL